MNHTNTTPYFESPPFTLESGTDATINSAFVFFLLVSAGLLYLSITKDQPVFKIINLFWFITWTVVLVQDGAHAIYITILFLAGFVPMFVGGE